MDWYMNCFNIRAVQISQISYVYPLELLAFWRGKNMNFFHQLTSEWHGCQGYFILRNVKFCLSLKGVNS
jgi:hypothetical protein